jgi:hypothetical protein
MGTVQQWELGLGAVLRLDVGLVRALGLGALSLWSLVPLWKPVDVVAGTGYAVLSADLGASLRVLPRIRGRRVWRRLWIRVWEDRLASRWALRSILSVVWPRPIRIPRRRHHQHLQLPERAYALLSATRGRRATALLQLPGSFDKSPGSWGYRERASRPIR